MAALECGRNPESRRGKDGGLKKKEEPTTNHQAESESGCCESSGQEGEPQAKRVKVFAEDELEVVDSEVA